MCRDGIKKSLMEQDLASDVKNNEKLFFRYTMSEKKGQGGCTPLINDKGELATGMETTEVLSEFFASAFTDSQVSHISQVSEHLVGVGRAKSLLL